MNHHVMHVYSVCFSWPSGAKSHPQATTSRHVQHKWKDWKPSSPCPSACAGQPLEPGSWSTAVPRQFESSASELEDWPPKAGQSQSICKWVRLYTVVNPFIFCCLWLFYIYIYIILSISVCVFYLKKKIPVLPDQEGSVVKRQSFLEHLPATLKSRSDSSREGIAGKIHQHWSGSGWAQFGLRCLLQEGLKIIELVPVRLGDGLAHELSIPIKPLFWQLISL